MKKKRPDIHLILSAFTRTFDEKVCLDDGYLIHSSSKDSSRTYEKYCGGTRDEEHDMKYKYVKYYLGTTDGDLDIESKHECISMSYFGVPTVTHTC